MSEETNALPIGSLPHQIIQMLTTDQLREAHSAWKRMRRKAIVLSLNGSTAIVRRALIARWAGEELEKRGA